MDIDPDRFLDDLRTLRGFGSVGKGVVRPAFSEPDIAARRWLAHRIEEAGLKPVMDAAGNVFGLAEGRGMLLGSHSDSQPEGGWLDGALGVIAGLEVARASRAAGGPPISVVSFQDEEGRFGALTGSEIWTGALEPDGADQLKDSDGISFAAARAVLGETALAPAPEEFAGYIELHIEQGPVLDEAGQAIGIVTDIVGARQFHLTFQGQQNHAGTTPMHLRRDAVHAFTRFAARFEADLAGIVTPETVWTIGQVDVSPNASSIVPGRVSFSLQWRDASEARLADIEAAAREGLAAIAAATGISVEIASHWALTPTSMDASLVARCADAAETCAPGAWRCMTSGALHDATNVAAVLPSAMVFVPSIGGISHSFAEDTREADLITGLRVLAAAAVAGGG